MKNPSDHLGTEPPAFRFVALCLKQLLYLLINCTIGKEISYFCATEIYITVFSRYADILCVTVDTSS